MASRTVSVRLQAEIGQYVSGMSKASAATMRLGQDATTSSKKAQGGFDLAGKGALLMGGAVVAGLGMAISKSMEFESAMSAVAAATGASASSLGDLREAAMKAGAETQYSATEAAKAITEMSKAGVSAADIMGGGLDGALALAAAGQLDVAKAAEIASVAMTQFNLTGEDLPHVADLLAAGAGKAMGSVEDLGAALNQSGLLASAAGLSIEETTGVLAAFASAGLVGSDAGTSLKTALQMLQAPTKKSAELMAELGIDMYDSRGNMLGASAMAGELQSSLSGLTEEERNAALATIFGSDAVRAANVLYKEGASGIADWTAKVNDQGYAADQAAKLTDNLKGDLERLGGAFDTLMIQMGSGAQGPLREVVQAFTGILDVGAGVLNFWSELSGPVQLAVGAALAWAVAGDRIMGLLGPMGSALGPMRGAWSSFGEALDYARRNGDGLGTVLQSVGSYAGGAALSGLKALGRAVGPELGIGVAVLGIGQLVTGIKSMSQASDEAKASAEGLADALTLTDKASDRKTVRNAIEDIDGLVEVLGKAGVSSEVAIDGLLGQADAQDKVLEALRRYRAEAYTPNGAGGSRESQDAREAALAYEELMTGYDGAAGAARYFADESAAAATGVAATGAAAATVTPVMAATAEQAEAAAKAYEDWLETVSDSLAGFLDPLGAYEALLDEKTTKEREAAEKTAASTEDATDSWEDYVTDVDVSLDELALRLEEQLLAQDMWRQNIGTITQRGGLEVGQILTGMGEEGVAIAAKMATGTDAEFNRMKDALIAQSHAAGEGAAGEMDTYMKIMAANAASGGRMSVQSLSKELGIGVDEVRRIAGLYSINLADGINPVLKALNKPLVRPFVSNSGANGFNTGGGFAEGGYTGPGTKYQPAGIVHAGEYVLTQDEVNRLGIDAIEAFANRGYAAGGFVTAADVPRPRSTAPYGSPISTAGDATMQTGYDETTKLVSYLASVAATNAAKAAAASGFSGGAGPVGNGTLGGNWASLFATIKAIIPQARINSAVRNTPDAHGRGKAVDFGFGTGPGGAGSAGLALINRTLHDRFGGSLYELIYDGIGDDRPDLKNSRPLNYGASTQAQHRNHVHAAVYDQGGIMAHGTGGINLSGFPERVLNPRETAAYDAGMRAREFSGAGGARGGGSVTVAPPVVKVFLDGQEWRGMARVEAEGVVIDVEMAKFQRGQYNG